jgi:hypothetical protein
MGHPPDDRVATRLRLANPSLSAICEANYPFAWQIRAEISKMSGVTQFRNQNGSALCRAGFPEMRCPKAKLSLKILWLF